MNLLLLITTIYLTMTLGSSVDSTNKRFKRQDDLFDTLPGTIDTEIEPPQEGSLPIHNSNETVALRSPQCFNLVLEMEKNITDLKSIITNTNIQGNCQVDGLCVNVSVIQRSDYSYTDVGTYKLHTIATTWNDAREICIDEGGELAIVDTDKKLKVLQGMFVKKFNAIKYAELDAAFIGVHDLFSEKGDWLTIYGDKYMYDRPHMEMYPIGRCLAFDSDGGLHGISCYNRQAFVCELPQRRCTCS